MEMTLETKSHRSRALTPKKVLASVVYAWISSLPCRDFPGGSVAKTPRSQCGGPVFMPHMPHMPHMPQRRVRKLQRRPKCIWCSQIHTLKKKKDCPVHLECNREGDIGDQGCVDRWTFVFDGFLYSGVLYSTVRRKKGMDFLITYYIADIVLGSSY